MANLATRNCWSAAARSAFCGDCLISSLSTVSRNKTRIRIVIRASQTTIRGSYRLPRLFILSTIRYPVSSRINHVANDDDECSRPVELVETQNRLFSTQRPMTTAPISRAGGDSSCAQARCSANANDGDGFVPSRDQMLVDRSNSRQGF